MNKKLSIATSKAEFDINHGYDRWLSRNFSRQADLEKMAETWKVFPYQPVISIIMPVYNTPEDYLRQAIDSVTQQIYSYWELCIADDASTDPHVHDILKEYSARDARIKVIYRPENGHIVRCSNTAIDSATGEFVALLDHDDLITPDALYEAVLLLNLHPEVDMIYSDEDHIDEQNRFSNPCFKSGWCPESLLSKIYTSHLSFYRRSIVTQIGGFRPGYEGSQDYDLVLRFTEATDKIFHIPKILYHWRIHPQSVASGSAAKPYAFQAAQRALADALLRRGEPGTIEQIENYGVYRIRYKITDYKPVSILIEVKDLQHLDRCLNALFSKSTYPHYEVILIGQESPELDRLISQYPQHSLSHYSDSRPYNSPQLHNLAASKARGDLFLFLDDATEIISADWIEALVEQAQRSAIGAVSGLLINPDHTIYHAGIILGVQGIAGYSHSGLADTHIGYFGQVIGIHNYSAVSSLCLMCRREAFEQVKGFNEDLLAYSDIDFCLKLKQQGWRNVYLPHVKLYHHRPDLPVPSPELPLLKQAADCMKRTWQQTIDHDPCYNPNLTRLRTDYSIRDQPEGGQIDAVVPLQQLQRKFKQTQSKLESTQQALDQSQARLTAMETSKFWQLRKAWFQVKRSIPQGLRRNIGLPTQE